MGPGALGMAFEALPASKTPQGVPGAMGGVPTCHLPPTTITLTRTASGTIGAINESVYSTPADSGGTFRISDCQYLYNIGTSALGPGTYQVEIKIQGSVVGSAMFGLR